MPERLLLLHLSFVFRELPTAFASHRGRGYACVVHHIILQPGKKVGIVLVLYGLRIEFGKAFHETVRGLVVHFKKANEHFSGFGSPFQFVIR